jgi:hypothetical protein
MHPSNMEYLETELVGSPLRPANVPVLPSPRKCVLKFYPFSSL